MTTHFAALPRKAQAFLGTVTLAGLFAIAHSVHALYSSPVPPQWFVLAALTLLSGSITIRLPSIPATISVSETFVFTAVLLFGVAAGTITVTLDGLIISLWLQRKNLDLYKLIFNTTAPAISIWLSAQLFFFVTGSPALAVRATAISGLLPGLLLFATTYFLLNSWLMAIAVSLEGPESALLVWRENFLWLSLNFFSGASVAILLVSLNPTVNLGAVAVIIPLLIISYLTYHTSMGRVEDANAHVAKINKLYLSTIETLALAIDAKDQVTHGHIRRVQTYSVQLAKQLGIRDHKLIMAIEAASLLHDMGKLAIPEHILNKPGKLTAAEFEIMKVHARIGADILAAVDFPYPVVPIVRHHHENWNGSGYPDGLAATDIPIGARILSVVDCFDALTSDRPYRGRLSDNEAIEILESRRGNMYDPLVVDAFLAMYRTLELPTHVFQRTQQDAIALAARLELRKDIDASRAGVTELAEQEMSPWRKGEVPYRIDVMGAYLARIAPGSMVILYGFDPGDSCLRVMRVWGNETNKMAGFTVPTTNRLSGLAATIGERVDGNASSDFSSDYIFILSRFGAASAVPLAINDHSLGVLTIYFPVHQKDQNICARDLRIASNHLTASLPRFHCSEHERVALQHSSSK